MAESLIKLNVGGKRFITTRTTIESIPDTFFTPLLNGSFTPVTDEKGYIFIDRDPDYFQAILHFMRSGVVRCPPHLDSKLLDDECQFYGLGTKLQAQSTTLDPKIGYSDQDLTDHIHERRELVERQRQDYLELTKHEFYLRNEKVLSEMKEAIFGMLARIGQSFYHFNRFLIFFLPSLSSRDGIPLPPSSYISELDDYKTLPDPSQTTFNLEMVELLNNNICVDVICEKMKKEHSLTLHHVTFLLELVSVVSLRGTEKWVKGGKNYGRVLARITGHGFAWVPKAYKKENSIIK